MKANGRGSLVAGAALLIAAALPACSAQQLSRDVYVHEQAALIYDTRGDAVAAAAERRAAAHDRAKLERDERGGARLTVDW